MTAGRPDPDQLLAGLREKEERERRAKLKIFFGAAAGVGKTFAMLVEAHERRAGGVDVVVGIVETHGREETARWLEGIEVLPRRRLDGASIEEFDLDAALARHPALILVDELAHTNAPGSRHAKRWQDVLELLDAGIDVYTTLNVQHVEALNDVVAQITGVLVREIVPDDVLDRADEIELIDLPPDDLLQRLREGKVYVPAQAETAMRNFFRKRNLIALRELALRRTAERVDAEMESMRRAEGIAEPWPVRERLLLCIGDPERGLQLVRATRRIVTGLKADWLVAHVETPAELRWPQERRDYVVDVMAFAQDYGAEPVMLQGLRVDTEILALARARNISRILVGKPSHTGWRRLLGGSLVHALVERSRDVDVYVITGEVEGEAPARMGADATPAHWTQHAQAFGVVLACTAIAAGMYPYFELTNLVMIYLLGVMVVALWLGRAPAIVASVLSVAAFDFFFVPPRFTFAVSDTEYLVTFAVMLAVALASSTMANWLRLQTEAARRRERRTGVLNRMIRELAARTIWEEMIAAAARLIGEEFDGRVALLFPDDAGHLAVRAGELGVPARQESHERGVAQWAFDHGQSAGLGTATLPASRGLYIPLPGTAGPLGVLGLTPGAEGETIRPEQLQFLETLSQQAALALERGRLAEQSERARVQIESERVRNALLSSVSHDFRTPLAVITGAATSLRDADTLEPRERRELATTIAEESDRLTRHVGDLLDITRLEAGSLEVRKEWHSLEEVVGGALTRLQSALAGREVHIDVSAMPLVPLDDVLIGQVIFNLVDNALRYSPPGSPIEVVARREADKAVVEVADRGPGLAGGDEERVFEKFYRAREGSASRGVGLGLAICRGIVAAHGGHIDAENRGGGGTVFRFQLPIEGEPPRIEPEPAEPPAVDRA